MRSLIGLHLGALHPYEKVLTLVLAFGPFVVLGAVIALRAPRTRPRTGRRRLADLGDLHPATGLDDERLAQLVERRCRGCAAR